MTKTKTLSDLIDACKFYYVNENIKKLFFLEPVRGKVEIKSFAKNMSSEDVIAELTKDGYVPANFTELLTYYAENQPRKDIVALGSIVSFEGGRRVPYVWLDSAGRYCILDWFGDDWVADCWFAYIKLEQTKNNAMKNNHRDRHYIRVWEAMHTNNEKLLAKMCFDGEYCSLLPFMLTAFQLQWAVERGDTVRIEWITKGLQNDANRVSS